MRSLLSSAGIWDLEDLGLNDVYFIVYLRLSHALASMAYLITIHEVNFCIYFLKRLYIFYSIVFSASH